MQSASPFQLLKDSFDGVGWDPFSEKSKISSIYLQSTKEKYVNENYIVQPKTVEAGMESCIKMCVTISIII